MQFLALGAAGLIVAACGAPGKRPDTTAEVSDLVSRYMAQENIPGVSVVVLKGDKAVLRQGFGVAESESGAPMATDRPQPIYSVSKQFTAVLILRLVEQTLVDLDAPVGRYVAGFEDEPALTVRMLLRQTSGLKEFISLPEIRAVDSAPRGTGSIAETVSVIERQPRRFAPGARFSYSNSNYTVLARIAEVVTGRTFDEALEALVIEPAGIEGVAACDRVDRAELVEGHVRTGVTWSLPENLVPNYSGNGGLCASADALASWTRALGSGEILNAALMAELKRTEPVTGGYTPPYGFGVSLRPIAGYPAISHSGSDEGWGAWAAHLTDEDLTIVVLANRGWIWSSDLGAPLVRIFMQSPAPAPPERLQLSEADRAALPGAYEDGLFDIEIVAEPDRIMLENPAFGDPIEFWKQPDGTFLSKDRPDTFALRRADDRIELDWLELRSYFERRSE